MLPANNPQVGSTTEVIDSVLPLREGKLPSKIYDLKGALLSLLEVGEGRKKKLAVPREAGEQDESVERQLAELLTIYMRLVDYTTGALGRANTENNLDRKTGERRDDVEGVPGVNLRAFAEQQLQWLRRELALLDPGYAELDRWPDRGRDSETSEVRLHVNKMRKGFVQELIEMLDGLTGALSDPIESQQARINALVALITRYHGDFNDVLIVEALSELRLVAEKQRGTPQNRFNGCRSIFSYAMNVLYAEAKISNDEITTFKRPCFPQFDKTSVESKLFMRDFERFFYSQKDKEGKLIDVYAQKKALYTADSGNVYEYGIVYGYPKRLWKDNPEFVDKPSTPLGNAAYFIIAYDSMGKPLPGYTINPSRPIVVENRLFATDREAVEDLVFDQCRAREREREEAQRNAKNARE